MGMTKGWMAGVAATVVSGVLVFWLTQGISPKSTTENIGSSLSKHPQQSATIMVSYDLATMEEGEAIVYIRGQKAGNLHVNKEKTHSAFSVTLPESGTYEYSIQGRMEMMGMFDGFEMPFETESNGRGVIEVEHGKEFVLSTNNLNLGHGAHNSFYAALSDKGLD